MPRGKTPDDDNDNHIDHDHDDDHLDLQHSGLEAPALPPHPGAASPPQLALGAVGLAVTAANLETDGGVNIQLSSIVSPLHTLPPATSQPTAHSDIFSMNCLAWRAL